MRRTAAVFFNSPKALKTKALVMNPDARPLRGKAVALFVPRQWRQKVRGDPKMNRQRQRRRSEAGYSLAELLVVIVIIGLAAAVTIPNVGSFFRAYKIRTNSDQLVAHLRAARQIAVSQHLPVTFTIS